jgi:hypothetical protein
MALLANDALAQATQVVDDKDLGVRFTIPKDWTWRSRDREVFVNCAPKIESRPGMPGCHFTLAKHKAAAGQRAITDADRAQWKSWTVANGMRPFMSSRDLRIAGFPAFELLVMAGTERDAATSRRVFILIPNSHVIDAWHYAEWNDEDQYPRTNPGFAAALETLTLAK